ncbi:SGNH/GDSL hydrolase family protein [Phaeobacter marinintestinus]|uniref:SGNH/GDSL hydrolase family protein n=1 Tax=Falsiphaeobacter marinintestinus TaxID=1492905 RepID=UPI0011B60971|nr:SGNH/GDSL hydrolase family protein [Phaeobacter marinintestinus]
MIRRLTQYPVAVAQAIQVIRVAQRLPEPDGARAGATGAGSDLKLLVFGDSSAAGVGVTRQQDALAGHLVAGLSLHHTVSWQLEATSGATTVWGVKTLQDLAPAQADIAVLSLGINDVKNGVPQRIWAKNVDVILTLLTQRHSVRRVYWTALPPIGRFPLLPDPLRALLGQRGDRFDAALKGLIHARPEGRYVPLDLDLDETHMAPDGFHPGPRIYAEWADRVCTAILDEPLQDTGR